MNPLRQMRAIDELNLIDYDVNQMLNEADVLEPGVNLECAWLRSQDLNIGDVYHQQTDKVTSVLWTW